ncbi:zinc-dependent metalloprotease [Myxococcota bacterium]|nr:zinc-dependent metalloprotease [Myxococcota bacterium]
MFEGIWYHRATVVGADPESGETEGITSNTEKLRWEITEDMLIGYRSYEFVPYGEGLTDDGRDFFGSPVVAFPILSHFDIQRDYNPTTGVSNNVIVENTTDRPWFERRFMRVDWSKNHVGTNFLVGWPNYPTGQFTGLGLSAYYTQGHEDTNPDRPFFTQDYFDVTNVYQLEPDAYFCNMMLLYNGVPRCGAANVRVRLSFKKIDPKDDYESLYYPDVLELKDDAGNAIVLNSDGRRCDGNRDPSDCMVQYYPMDSQFGNFRVSRVAWDKERMLTRTGRMYVAGRFDLWEDSFADADGSRIPYDQRKAKPIIYYGNVDFPDDMLEHATRMANYWNKPFMETVAQLQNKLTSDGRPDITALRNELGFDMYQFRQNSCNVENIKKYAVDNGLEEVVERVAGGLDRVARGNVAQVCAAVQAEELRNGKSLDPKSGKPLAFTWQRTGDLRFSFQNYIENYNVYGPWGVAQFGQDFETGEFFSNTANYFATAGDMISQSETDLIQWLNGDLSEEELFRGDIARNSVISRRGVKNNSIRSVVRDMLMAHEGNMLEAGGDTLFTETPAGGDEARFERMFKGTSIERELLVNDELLRGFAGPTLYQPTGQGVSGSNLGESSLEALLALTPGDVSEEAIAAASPVSWGLTPDSNPYETMVRELGARAWEMADFFDPNTAGLAESFKGETRDNITNWLRKELFLAVEMHEVGHTLGLRHNFEASMDALNYKPDFWYKENSDGSVTQYWNDPARKGNPNRGSEYKYASIMDYGFDIPLEGLHGLGTYDEAAIRFQYGQLVHVWDPEKVSIPDPRKFGSWARRCGFNSDFYGLPGLLSWLGPDSIPSIFSQEPVKNEDGSRCVPVDPNTGVSNYDSNEACDSQMDKLYRELVVRTEAAAARFGDKSQCTLMIADMNTLLADVHALYPDASTDEGREAALAAVRRISDARKLVTVDRMIQQQQQVLANQPEWDEAGTNDDESRDGQDNDGDGVADDKGFDWANYLYPVEYKYCSDMYASYSNPRCQRWDMGWDFVESTDSHIMKYDRDYVFDHFRRDRFTPGGWGRPRTFMARLESRMMYHMTNVFRYYLYTRRTAFQAPIYKDWADAAYRGLNFLERVLQTPEPGRYCLNTARNVYELDPTGTAATCEQEMSLGLGYGQGKYLNTAWTNEYFYKANRIGSFYDKLTAIRQLTTSSGFFVRDVSDLFDRRAFSLGYIRVFDDPIIQRFSALIQGDHEGYRSAIVEENGEKYVRYMPFFDEELTYGQCTQENEASVCTIPGTSCNALPGQVGTCIGGSVRESLATLPKVEPAWSWTLQFMALGYAISNFSSINDLTPEFYRYTKIAIKGTPEDITYPADMTIVEFTDPESLITYRSPDIPGQPPPGLVSPWPAYYGDAFHRRRGEFRDWGIGATLLRKANAFLTDVYEPAKAACPDPVGNAAACPDFVRARRQLNEQVGFIDIVRRFNYRAEF